MIAYNKEWLHNLQTRNEINKAVEQGCITQLEKEQVFAAYPAGFYSPNIFVRIGLFILTMIIVQFSLGLVALMFFSATKVDSFGAMFIFYSLLIYGGLEFMVKKKSS